MIVFKHNFIFMIKVLPIFMQQFSYIMRSLHNLTIFVTQEKRMDFSEVTGVRALFFRNLSVGETAGLPIHRSGDNAEGVKLPHR
jgi:hypothetical protein